ncbi:MAG: sugar transferase [Candidatus Electrothrix sp. AX5]|nr:sugar transferase [Candidatus Electrothrix sp. AX5]
MIRPLVPISYAVCSALSTRKKERRRKIMRPSKKAIRLAEVFTDFFVLFLAVVSAYCLYRYFIDKFLPGGIVAYCQLGLFSGLVGTMTFYFIGLYRHQASMMNLLETRKIIKITLLLFLLLILYTFFSRAQYSRITLCLALILALPSLLFGRFIFFKFNQYLYLRGVNVRRVLIYGAGSTGRVLFQSILNTPKLGYEPLGFFDPAGDKEQIQELCPQDPGSILLLANSEQCVQAIEEHKVQDIFLSSQMNGEELFTLLAFCRDRQVAFHIVPYLQPLFTEQVELSSINGIPLVSFKEQTIEVVEDWLRRGIDLVISFLFLFGTAPFALSMALLVKLDSKGPVLFRQTRIGKNGVPFTIYKFRTMYTDAPVFHNSPTESTDARITRVGRFLRKTSLDELPQFLNVLEGTMSLVGPRPEMEFIVNNVYNDLYRQRLRVKPGITGIWQISADRTREIHEDISYDLFYIANRSLLLDMLILIRTVPALFMMKTH